MEKIAKEGSGFEDSENEEVEEIKYCINTLRGFGFEFI